MLDARRKAYLQAIGIDLWSVRQNPVELGGSSVPAEQPEQPDLPKPEPIVAVDKAPVEQHPSSPASEHDQPPVFEVIPTEAYADMRFDEEEDESRFDDFLEPPVSHLDWSELAERVSNCRACELCESRTQTVFGVGNQTADLMIVGEAPGADEDRQGEPFVGRAGQLLTQMLLAIGLPREQVYIANILKCRPPANRDPHVNEIAACQPYLDRQIALIQPKLILSLGGISAKNLLGSDLSVARLRSKVHQYQPTQTPLIVTYHPAYLLRRAEEKAKVWQDLQQVWRYLREAKSA